MRYLRIIKYLLVLCLVLSIPVKSYALNTNLSVTATVPASASDFQTSISSSSTGTEPYPQDTSITYTITYGSTLNQLTSFTLQAHWNEGDIAGGGTADIVGYVVSSASTGYGGATPIIDTVNKTIEWEIEDLPANTVDHTVSFTLKTNSNYTGNSVVTFTTESRILGPSATTLFQEIDHTYQYENVATPTPTPTTAPSPTSQSNTSTGPSATPTQITTTPTSAPTKRIYPPNPTISDVEITKLSAILAELKFSTDTPTTYELLFGTNVNNLTMIEKSLELKILQNITVSSLHPETKYYFRIRVIDKNGKSTTSDIFTFTTAQSGKELLIDHKYTTISWRQDIIATSKSPIIHVSGQKPITINIPIENPENVKSITMKFVNKHVLGIQDGLEPPPEHQISLKQSVAGIYSGQLQTPRQYGRYQVVLEIHETTGAFYAETLPYYVIVGPPFRVVNSLDNKPVENALVTITRDAVVKIHTNHLGELDMVFPSGRYKVRIDAPGYASEDYEFTLDDTTPLYPTFELTPSSFFTEKIRYFTTSIGDVVTHTYLWLKNLIGSPRGQEISFISLFIATALYSIFVLKKHVSKIVNRKNSKTHPYFRWVVNSLTSSLGFYLIGTNLVLTFTTFYISGLVSGAPFLITLILSIISWNISLKDAYEGYR